MTHQRSNIRTEESRNEDEMSKMMRMLRDMAIVMMQQQTCGYMRLRRFLKL